MKQILLLCLLAGAVGCCKPKTVYVPVPCPKPILPPRPVAPIKTLKADDSVEHERKLWLATVQAYEAYWVALEKLLEAYQ